MEQQQDHNTHLDGHHGHRGRKEHHHLWVRGHRGRCCGGHHGHKHHGRHGNGHGHRLGNGHGFVPGQEQIEHGGGQMTGAHASGGEQPQPESFGGEMIHHHRHRHSQGHGHHPYKHHCGQVTETGAPNELSGGMVRMHLEDEPQE